MTHDEIIAMALAAGFYECDLQDGGADRMLRLVKLAEAKGREACLLAVRASTPCITENDARVVANCLGAIRARGQKEGA